MERSINGEDIKLRLELIILFAAKAVPALSALKPAAHDMASPGATP